MLKYASKLFLQIILSVLATVIGSFFAQHYNANWSPAKAPVSLAETTVDPTRAGANAVRREAAQAEVPPSEGSPDAVSAIGPVAAISGRDVEQTSDEKVIPPCPAEPTGAPAWHPPVPRDKHLSRTNISATPGIASKIAAPPEPVRATTERIFSTSGNSSIAAPPRPKEIERKNDLSPPLDPETEEPHLSRRILKPIIRTALLLLEPVSPARREREPERRAPPDEILSSSRVVPPEAAERSLSRTWVSRVC